MYKHVEMIDYDKYDSMIQICRKLDKSNTLICFRCVIFRSFYSNELFQTNEI